MDVLPNQLIRLLQLNQLDKILNCDAIWLCVSCQTCTARCPQNVDCAGVLDALRQLSVQRQSASLTQKRIWSFQQAFLSNIRRNGRLNELELIGVFKSKSFADDWSVPGLFKDSLLAPQLMRRGKFHASGQKVKDRAVVRRIFDRCLEPSRSGSLCEGVDA
jgi:heterodisulfide reductase subunit C